MEKDTTKTIEQIQKEADALKISPRKTIASGGKPTANGKPIGK